MPRAVATIVLVALIASSVAGCLGADDAGTAGPRGARRVDAAQPTGPKAAVPLEVKVHNGSALTFATSGVGWGRVLLKVEETSELNISISHPRIHDLDIFSGDGDGIYDDHNYTAIFVFPEDESPVGPRSYAWYWWGSPGDPWWPSTPRQPTLTIDGGKAAVLLVATTVPDFTINVTVGKVVESSTVGLRLGPRQGHELFLPAVKDTATVDQTVGKVQRVREWTTGPVTLNASIAFANSWSAGAGPSVAVGVEQDETRMTPSRSQAGGIPFPITETNPDSGPSGGASRSMGFLLLPEPATVEMYRLLQQSYVGMENNVVGVGFLVIPTQFGA